MSAANAGAINGKQTWHFHHRGIKRDGGRRSHFEAEFPPDRRSAALKSIWDKTPTAADSNVRWGILTYVAFFGADAVPWDNVLHAIVKDAARSENPRLRERAWIIIDKRQVADMRRYIVAGLDDPDPAARSFALSLVTRWKNRDPILQHHIQKHDQIQHTKTR